MATATLSSHKKGSAVFVPTVFSIDEKSSEDTIVLDLEERERKLFEIVKSVTRKMASGEIGWEPLPHKHVQIRVAGGWVRDKILGIPSDDIDLAIENYTGFQFAQLLQEYLESAGYETKRIGIIAANPDQSKHLATACMRVEGLDIDLCHLRSQEVYTHSRIPDSVTFGSPLDDSERRDFTCNALFYNIESRQIEDWTGRGLVDLKRGELVTPLEPLTTFLDDPLRVLRAIRFAVRYGYTIVAAETIRKEESIRQALMSKVSRERVGKEVEGMLSGKFAKPTVAMQTILDLGLADVVFATPPLGAEFSDWQVRGRDFLTRVEHIKREVQGAIAERQGQSQVDERLLPLLAVLLPLRKGVYTSKKNKELPVVHYIVSESIKFSKRDANSAVTIFSNLDSIIEQTTLFSKVKAGLLLRETKGLWVTALALAAIEQPGSFDVAEAYGNLFPLDNCWTIRPLLDGKALKRELKLKAGPSVGEFMREQVVWMLENPSGSKDECLSHLQKKRKQDS